jgi:hypothetical protein
MNQDGFEREASRQPLRPVPAEWRREILAAARTAVEPERVRIPRAEPVVNGWTAWWRPGRLAWGSLAAAWMAIFTLNWAANRPGGPGAVEAVYSPAVVAMAWQQSRRMAFTLDGGEAIDARSTDAVRPRSARMVEWRAV